MRQRKRQHCAIKAIDFFCGAGGLTRGFLDAGIQVLAGVDSDATLRDTYQTNNSPSRFIAADIKKTDIHELRSELGITAGDAVLYSACTPCQPFSTLNRMKGEDERRSLLLTFAELVQDAPPDYIVVENVPGLSNACGRSIYERFLAILEDCGFNHVCACMLDAQEFGVPQVRKRFILLASRHDVVTMPKRSPKRMTVRDAISHYPQIGDGETAATDSNHRARSLKPHLKRIVEAVPPDGGSRRDVKDTSVLLKCHQENPETHRDVFGRMAWDAPAPTLTCRCTDVYCGRFTHPEQHRGMSLREAAAIQTFPDSYTFHGTSLLQLARQVGNAVPVKLASRLAKSILNSHRRTREADRG